MTKELLEVVRDWTNTKLDEQNSNISKIQNELEKRSNLTNSDLSFVANSTINDELVTRKVNILINNGNNVLFNPAIKFTYVGQAEFEKSIEIGMYKTSKPSSWGNVFYITNISGLMANTTYKMYINVNKSFDISDWNEIFIESGTIGTVSDGGCWIEFTTNSNICTGKFKHEPLFRSVKYSNGTKFSDTMCVKAEDWNEELEIANNVGYFYDLDVSLKSKGNVSDLIIYKDERFFLKEILSEDGELLLNPILTPLSVRANNILTCASYMFYNLKKNFDISFVDEFGNKINSIEFAPLKYNYVQTYGSEFVHNNYKYTITAMNMSRGVEVDWKFIPHSILQIIDMGYNTIQLDVSKKFQYNEDGTINESDYQNFFDKVDFIISCGLRVIFKFYTFNWESADVTNFTKEHEKLIINRYKNNPSVIGYSIANEPSNNKLNTNDANIMSRYRIFINTMQKYIQDNTTQITFIERTEYADLTLPNTVFETHWYDPHLYTHHADCSYPDTNVDVIFRESEGGNYSGGGYLYANAPTITEDSITEDNDGFSWITTDKFTKNEEVNGNPVFYYAIQFTSDAPTDYMDIKEIHVRFYDKDLNVVRERIKTFSSDTNVSDLNYGYIKDGKGKSSYEITVTDENGNPLKNDKGKIVKKTIYYSTEYIEQIDDFIRVKPINIEGGYSYAQLSNGGSGNVIKNRWAEVLLDGEVYIEVSVLARGVASKSNTFIKVMIQRCYHGYASPILYNQDYFKKFFTELVYPSIKTRLNGVNIPIYIGEYGTMQSTALTMFYSKVNGKQNLNGEAWVRDITDVIRKLDLSSAYFTYWGAAFGLHNSNTSRENDADAIANGIGTYFSEIYLNTGLYNTLIEINKNNTDVIEDIVIDDIDFNVEMEDI